MLAAFGVFVINNELRLFAHAKVAHNHLHNQFLESRIIDGEVQKAAIDRLSAKSARWTWFDIYAHLLVIVLFVISLGNTCISLSLLDTPAKLLLSRADDSRLTAHRPKRLHGCRDSFCSSVFLFRPDERSCAAGPG
jgi:hypothetical protein